MLTSPETRFARVGDDRVAYQVLGDGPRALLITNGFFSSLELHWTWPSFADYVRRLASFCRVIRFDRRGSGASDPPTNRTLSAASLADIWLEDCDAVLDAAEARTSVLMGASSAAAGALVLMLAARRSERCSGLILANTHACWMAKPGYPEGASVEAIEQYCEEAVRLWGTPEWAARVNPSRKDDPEFLAWFAKLQRTMASPRLIGEALQASASLDARDILPRIRCPTLVLARPGLQAISPARCRYLAEHIAGARYVELPGADQLLWTEHADDSIAAIEQFMTGGHHASLTDRRLATVLFTDIVDSTRRATRLGTAEWRRLLDHHDRVVRDQVGAFGGRFIEAAGDGTLASFEAPRRALDCAFALHDALRPLRIDIRAGVHCGEVEMRGDGRMAGVAVHIGARVMAAAAAGEVLASHSIHGLLMGSDYAFEERGVHELKGIPGRWPLYAVRPSSGGH